MLHSHQLAEKELKGHQLQQELTHELTHEQAVSREKESEVQKLQQELSHEQAVSRQLVMIFWHKIYLGSLKVAVCTELLLLLFMSLSAPLTAIFFCSVIHSIL